MDPIHLSFSTITHTSSLANTPAKSQAVSYPHKNSLSNQISIQKSISLLQPEQISFALPFSS